VLQNRAQNQFKRITERTIQHATTAAHRQMKMSFEIEYFCIQFISDIKGRHSCKVRALTYNLPNSLWVRRHKLCSKRA